MLCFFFFQAEDGIRDLTVTGVQTCALPISPLASWVVTAVRGLFARSKMAISFHFSTARKLITFIKWTNEKRSEMLNSFPRGNLLRLKNLEGLTLSLLGFI